MPPALAPQGPGAPDVSALLARIGQLERLVMPFAYVSNSEANTVTSLNLLMNTAVPEITVGSSPTGIAKQPGGTQVWVTNKSAAPNAPALSIIDTVTGTVFKTMIGDLRQLGSEFQDFHPLQEPQSVAFNSSGSRVYIGGEGFLATFDTATMTPLSSHFFRGSYRSLRS